MWKYSFVTYCHFWQNRVAGNTSIAKIGKDGISPLLAIFGLIVLFTIIYNFFAKFIAKCGNIEKK